MGRDLENQNRTQIDTQEKLENSSSNVEAESTSKKRKHSKMTNTSEDDDTSNCIDTKSKLEASKDMMESESTDQHHSKRQRQLKQEENSKELDSDTDDEEYDLRKALKRVTSSSNNFILQPAKLGSKKKKNTNKRAVNQRVLANENNHNDYAFPHRSINIIAYKLHIPLSELQNIIKQIWSDKKVRKELAISSLKNLWKSYNTKPSTPPYLI